MRFCLHCYKALSPLVRGDARYCSSRCRVAAHRLSRSGPVLPSALTELPRWIRYSARKVPLTVDDRAASSVNPVTWSTYEDACGSTAGVGLGFVLNGDGIVCLDIDHCVTDGVPDDWTRQLLRDCAGTYIEVSPSGTGLHIWGTAALSFGGRTVSYGPGNIEIYGTGRYLTITGCAYTSSRTLKPLGRVIRSICS